MNHYRPFFLQAVFALLLVSPSSFSAPSPQPFLNLQLINDGKSRFHVEAKAWVNAPEQIVWGTLRDYDAMSRFIPMLVVSRRMTYRGAPAIEQVGQATFLVFHFRAKTVLVETPDARTGTLNLQAVAGDFSVFDSHWTLSPQAGGTAITLRSEAVLKRWVPQWLARHEARRSVGQSVNALLAEMSRRADAVNKS